MYMVKVLIFECTSIDGFTSSAIVVSKVTTLGHEARDHSMEDGSFKVQWLATGVLAFLPSS